MDRREFVKGTAWMGAAAFAVGCTTERGLGLSRVGKMSTFAVKPFEKLRIGVVGLGRGYAGVCGFDMIPGCEVTAICDLNAARIKKSLDHIEKSNRPKPAVYTGGPEEWKRLCDDPNVDLVYNATPWQLHAPVALYAMQHAGKHVVTEVPSALTVDHCWELVETAEKYGLHCMQLENCCYGENEMLILNLCRKGMLGELVHAEGAYIHDLRTYNWGKWNDKGSNPSVDPETGYPAYWNYWRLRHNAVHKGNQYPTHGLGPICWYMDINRGDRFDYLVSLESNQLNFEAFAKARFATDGWQANQKVQMGDMNTTLIKTKRGRSILIQHDVSSPRPYSRLNSITGTKGAVLDFPLRIVWEDKPGAGAHAFFDKDKLAEVCEKYKHPLWRQAGDIAKRTGGHGGMDFLMLLRLAYCLQNGLPLDQSVYDLASWCCLCELTEKSVRNRSCSVDIPDFTRGGWETAKPIDNITVDLEKMGGKA
ncbi:MAG: Gfo/Idh/MocA family oxidoreductase [Kiritimatiellae bacterium]|nr:Gfo/Idh/MocA family oxidoreductase [Kiritimatiellia bacterium]